MLPVDSVWLDFLEFISLRNDRWVYYRGHSNEVWPLAPGIARPDKSPPGGWRPDLEKQLFADFKRLAQSFDPGIGYEDLDWLALAQHFGLPTRLLDWTENPLVAAWFAVANEGVAPGPGGAPASARIHVIRIDPNRVLSRVDPFSYSSRPDITYAPARAARITAQHGIFSVHRSPNMAWNPSADGHLYETFDIPNGSKEFFRKSLHQLGFNRQRLMTDLEGLCATLAWSYRNRR